MEREDGKLHYQARTTIGHFVNLVCESVSNHVILSVECEELSCIYVLGERWVTEANAKIPLRVSSLFRRHGDSATVKSYELT